MFNHAVPSFNLKGNSRVGTVIGGLLSLTIIYITFLYGCTRLLHLYKRKNPTINTYERSDAFSTQERLSLNEFNFMMAFTMENYFSGQTLDDPRYVKWVATYEVVQDGKIDSKELPVYQCSDEDYAKFYPFDERSEP